MQAAYVHYHGHYYHHFYPTHTIADSITDTICLYTINRSTITSTTGLFLLACFLSPVSYVGDSPLLNAYYNKADSKKQEIN